MNSWKPILDPVAGPPEEPTTESGIDLGVLADVEAQRPLPGRQRAVNSFTYFLLAAVGLLGAFSGGAWFQREHGAANVAAASANPQTTGLAPSGTIAGGAAQGRFGASGGTAPNGGQFAGGGATVGTVKLVDGNSVYVTDQSGNVVKVTAQPGLAVQVSKPGTLADLVVGETVIVQGTAGSDGTIAATSIQSGTTGAAAGRGPSAAVTTTTR
jgi:hypothetical protein